MYKTCKVSELQMGMMVSRVVEQSGPMKIRKVGMIRSPDMVKGLSEMGVSVVEIDLEQSIGIDYSPDVLPNVSPNTETQKGLHTDTLEPFNATPTQRLVASNKRISDADRHLSQQFHRSLFLPAVDQMPSKWTLYGKPYGVLGINIILGLALGFMAMYLPAHLMKSADTSDLSQLTPSEGVDSVGVTVDANHVPSTIMPASKASTDSKSLQNTFESMPTTDSNEAPETEETAPSTPEPVQLVTVNGVVIEDGQQVLGYQAPNNAKDVTRNDTSAVETIDDFVIQPNSSKSLTSVPAPFSNSELMLRAQQAAEEIDNRPEGTNLEPISVTDFNDVPRIDQLRPALLTQMPAMSFSAHMYASNQADRWVRVNSQRLGEGDFITNDIQLIHIEAERVVLSFKGTEFSMNALTDW